MKSTLCLLFLIFSFPLFSFCQSTAATFDEHNYTKVAQAGGPSDPDHPDQLYVLVYKSNQDASYTLKKQYLDSACTMLVSKTFFKSGVPEGPFALYSNGQLSLKGAYKDGNWEGERITYLNDVALQKAYFLNGQPTGTWEEYSASGNLKRKLTFDSSGKLTSDTKY